MKGNVYWITGLSGAGKTTIGTKLYYKIKENNSDTVLLDGDVVKMVFSDNNTDYSKQGRLKRAYQYSRLCKMLSDQGITVICCTIAMFDEVREFNRNNIDNYIEIFINVDFELLKKRDVKGLYNKISSDNQGMVDNSWEFPKNPHLIIKNTMNNNVEEYVNLIYNFKLENKNPDDQRQYWNDYYKKNSAPVQQSEFADFCLKYMEKGKKLIDLGCGNGRDSIFFANNDIKVTAIDSSVQAIEYVESKCDKIFAVCDDFTKAKVLFCVDYEYCYSRWTVHAISKEAQHDMFNSVSKAIKKDGRFFIEARTVNDVKYNQGINIGKDEFLFDNHYRRFLRVDEITQELKDLGFIIEYCEESDEFSIVGNDKPCLLRIVAKKCN